MSNSTFVFKQFEIKQDQCAMKVGTDAVLLGSWVNISHAKHILDIGTGTGIIALMLAQKCGGQIDAIDIDYNSFLQASENARNCPWPDRIHVFHKSLQDFFPAGEYKYDVIVSNPPYFVDSSKAIEKSRTNARHTDELPYDQLLQGVLSLLNTNGKFYVILPTKESEVFREMAEANKLYCTKITKVITRTDKPEKRLLMRFELTKRAISEDCIIIEKDERHSYSDKYKELTKDYYLAF